jgi:hypothetical protein
VFGRSAPGQNRRGFIVNRMRPTWREGNGRHRLFGGRIRLWTGKSPRCWPGQSSRPPVFSIERRREFLICHRPSGGCCAVPIGPRAVAIECRPAAIECRPVAIKRCAVSIRPGAVSIRLGAVSIRLGAISIRPYAISIRRRAIPSRLRRSFRPGGLSIGFAVGSPRSLGRGLLVDPAELLPPSLGVPSQAS